MLKPVISIAGLDVSPWFVSMHAEQTVDLWKDPDKVDITLANTRLRFSGKFKPTDVIIASIINIRKTCDSSITKQYPIFYGQVQLADADDKLCKIQASCKIGGMSSNLNDNYIAQPGTSIKKIVNDLLDKFGWTGGREIHVAVETLPRKEFCIKPEVDFLGAFEMLAEITGSWYFQDEFGTFWFRDPQAIDDAISLDGSLLNGSDRTSLIGYCNVVQVIGGSVYPSWEDGSEIPSQWPTIRAIVAAPAEELEAAGIIMAPPVFIPEANYSQCQEIAANLLEFYRNKRDNCKPKVLGVVPRLGSIVYYTPRNGYLGPGTCDQDKVTDGAKFGKVTGCVVKRIVDFSKEGLICDLEVATRISVNSGYVPIGKGVKAEDMGEGITKLSEDKLKQLLEGLADGTVELEDSTVTVNAAPED